MNTFTHQLRFAGRVMLALCLALPALAAELGGFETRCSAVQATAPFAMTLAIPRNPSQPGAAAVLATDCGPP